MGEPKRCSNCKHWSRGFEGMRNPSRAMHGACYHNGGRDIEDFEVTRFDQHCGDHAARELANAPTGSDET